MSTDDPLLRSFEALREAYDGKPDGSATRKRVLAGARRRADGRHPLLYVLIPVAATLLVSVAWADGAGRLGPWRAALLDVLEPSRAVRAVVPLPKVGASVRPSPAVGPLNPPPIQPEVRTTVADAPVEAAEPDAPVVGATRAASPATQPPLRRVPARLSVERAPSPHALQDTEDDLFAAAQTAHFGAHDAASALHAWDAYLAAFPRGRFELEARYNRATTLLRLGRDDEARAALLPFAQGSYRRREARLLLESLGEGR
jgi:hypothetical protein